VAGLVSKVAVNIREVRLGGERKIRIMETAASLSRGDAPLYDDFSPCARGSASVGAAVGHPSPTKGIYL